MVNCVPSSKWRPYFKKKPHKYSVHVELKDIKSVLCSEQSVLFSGLFCYTLQKPEKVHIFVLFLHKKCPIILFCDVSHYLIA